MKKFLLVKTKSIRDFDYKPKDMDQWVKENVATPKFSDPIKENEKNTQYHKRKLDLAVVILGEKLIVGIPIYKGNSTVLFPIPDLTTFYLNSAITLYNQSIDVFEDLTKERNLHVGDFVFANFADTNFYSFLMLRITVFSYLAIIIEYVLNKNIPATVSIRGNTKTDIEQTYSLTEKLKILNSFKKCDIKPSSKLFQTIVRCYQLRSDLLHPKTADSKFDNENAVKAYPEIIQDCKVHIECVIELIRALEPDALVWVGN